MKENKKLVTYRFYPDLLNDIETLSKITKLKKNTIVELALSEYIMKSMLPEIAK